jgi:hypothetical protein
LTVIVVLIHAIHAIGVTPATELASGRRNASLPPAGSRKQQERLIEDAMAATLVALAGPLRGEALSLGEDGLTIGGDSANQLHPNDLSLSRRHCRIGVDTDRVTIVDLDSAGQDRARAARSTSSANAISLKLRRN